MTDFRVDLDHLTSLSGRLDDAVSRLNGVPTTDGAALGVDQLDGAWSGFRQRRRDGLERRAADVARVADGLVRTRDAYAAAETAIERGLSS